MRKRNYLAGLTLGLGLSVTMMSAGASAAGISGKVNLICASEHVVACADGACMQGTPASFDLMTFMFVDVKRKLVHGVDADGKEVSSPVRNFDVTDSAIILQGFENHRGWTLGIDRTDGGLSMNLTGADVSFIISGNCTER